MEWNLNYATNIKRIGNYRYNPNSIPAAFNSYDDNDVANLYTNATDADIVIDGGVNDNGDPITFKSKKEQLNLFYSLEDCFGKFRPRSGINKYAFFSNKYIPESSQYMAQRPRYYFADKTDTFKYWTSYRTENGIEKGISTAADSSGAIIQDAAPFVVYKNPVATNKVVIKMQTNVGTRQTSMADPLYGDANKTVPRVWKIQKLNSLSQWQTIASYNNPASAINPDGYVEISYGIVIPEEYKNIFVYAGDFSSVQALPEKSYNGYAYLVKTSNHDPGIFAIWLDSNSAYSFFSAQYDWQDSSETISRNSNFVTDFSVANNEIIANTSYRQFDRVYGLRVVVDKMNAANQTFDLIELSPRLVADVTDRVIDFSTSKPLSDLSNAGLPVGNLLAATGSLNIFDFDQSFSENNTDSILHGIPDKNTQVKLFDVILDVVDNSGISYDYYVPIKVLYVEDSPEISVADRKVSMKLRDLNILFETTTAPQMLIVGQSLSYIATVLFDSIGFSNYKFLRVENEKDEVIPYFFIGPDTSVAQVLQQLAVSTQTAMFFDEQNNFVLMSKNYIMPTSTERATNLTLSENQNILGISTLRNTIYNAGKIAYTSRYIQKTYGSIEQSSYDQKGKTWIYKPVLLWEVSPPDATAPTNEEVSQQQSYALSAIPLSTTLSDAVPVVVDGVVTNNIIDFGDGIDWITRYSGYFYANGEVIKYDAVEYFVAGQAAPVWISSTKDYRNYFSKLTFNGKMYPTGRVRILSEPARNTDGSYKNGAVIRHGRGQFGTTIVSHNAGLSSEWTNPANLYGCKMNSSMILNGVTPTTTDIGAAGIETAFSKTASINGIIKNFLSTVNLPESTTNALKSTIPGTVQSSALVMNGPSYDSTTSPIDYISYVAKSLDNKFVHFGTRVRIIGSIGNSTDYSQQGVGSSTFYTVPASSYKQTITNPDGSTYQVDVSTKAGVIGGSSGGLGVLVNPKTNNGYYFEIAALTDNNVNNYSGSVPINNIFFYKIERNSVATSNTDSATPTLLWSGLAPILVDDGKFTGQSRTAGQQNPTVYDLAVEYEDIGNTRKFYLYVNNRILAIVDDNSPLPHVDDNNLALFSRGSSRLMFENVYALATNYAKDASSLVQAPAANNAFGIDQVSTVEAFQKYAMSGIVSSTYLSGISSGSTPSYNMYYDEFGTIMREAAYLNIRYDKAYPALIAKISPTFNSLKGYTVSGFNPNPYGAEFLIFNNTDTVLTLDEASGNYLRIQGVTFTQQSQNELTVDEYFDKVSDFSTYKFDPKFSTQENALYNDIKTSRLTYGKKEFSLDAPFIQSQDTADSMMDWVIKKVMKHRLSVGVDVFGLPIVQLGDILEINYTKDNIDQVSSSRFVVYQIDTSRSATGSKNTLYLSEVTNA